MSSVFFIAEAGVNHNGSIDIAKKMVSVAADCGADAVKFQTFSAKKLVNKKLEKANYQKLAQPNNESQYQMLKKLELSKSDHYILRDFCREKNIMFLSTAFDIQSAMFLEDVGIEKIKIASSELTNIPLLEYLGSLGKKTILSTGMATIEEIKLAIEILQKAGLKKKLLTLMHCVTEYPVNYVDANLNVINTLNYKFNIPVGYSDHSIGAVLCIAATAMGAPIIEKHFTLDNKFSGPDHKASATPVELKTLINSIRIVEKSLGSGVKEITLGEINNKKCARKSIIALKNIKKGELLSPENIGTIRAGDLDNAIKWNDIINKHSPMKFNSGDLIDF